MRFLSAISPWRAIILACCLSGGGASPSPGEVLLDRSTVAFSAQVSDEMTGASYKVEGVDAIGGPKLSRRAEGERTYVAFSPGDGTAVRHWDSGRPGFYDAYLAEGFMLEAMPLNPFMYRSYLDSMFAAIEMEPSPLEHTRTVEDGGIALAIRDATGFFGATGAQIPNAKVELDERGRPVSVHQWTEWSGQFHDLGQHTLLSGYLDSGPQLPRRIEILRYGWGEDGELTHHYTIEVESLAAADMAALPQRLAQWTGGLAEQGPGPQPAREGTARNGLPQLGEVALARASGPWRVAAWLIPAGMIALLGALWLRFRR